MTSLQIIFKKGLNKQQLRPSSTLFKNIYFDTGAKQDPRDVNRVMKRIIKSAHVPDIPFQGIRHTHASILFSEGVDIVRTSLRLGHSNPKTTLGIYAHLLPNSDHDVADIFHNAMQDSKDKM